MHSTPVRIFLAGFLALAAAAAAGGSELVSYVPSQAFLVSVAPIDEESRSADSSILYQRRDGEGEWENIGPCRKQLLPGGEVRFTREVRVAADGEYHYTSRPVVGGRVIEPPAGTAPPQAVVIVDTLAPSAELLAPAEDHEVLPGGRVTVEWTCADENLAENPAALAFTTDGGVSWTVIASGLPAEGEKTWTAPESLAGPAVLRLTASDRAGNIGRAVRRLQALKRPDAPARTAAGTPAEPETAAVSDGTPETSPDSRDPNRSWLYYLMAVNLMRQDKPADALQYYWLSVREDPEFIDAWSDIALAYIDLGAYKTARQVLEQTREKAPGRAGLMHLMGETYHAEGMAALAAAGGPEKKMQAKGLIDQAVEWYGLALEASADGWQQAEQAPSFYRLGEICYYVNLDRDGARAYWEKILGLHSPAPNPDLILWSAPAEREKARRQHQRYTSQRVTLEAWQNWARGYVEQLDARERAGILELMPAQHISAGQCLTGPAGGSAINPGRDDGRSLFSPPLIPEASAAAVQALPAAAAVSAAVSAPPAQTAQEDYSFYSKIRRPGRSRQGASSASPGGRSVFTGGPGEPPPPNPDPYAFPQGGRPYAPWHGSGPYGSEPVSGW